MLRTLGMYKVPNYLLSRLLPSTCEGQRAIKIKPLAVKIETLIFTIESDVLLECSLKPIYIALHSKWKMVMAPVTCVPHWVIILEQCELFLYKSKALLKVDFQVRHTILYRINALDISKKGKTYMHSKFKVFKEAFEKYLW